MTASPTIQSTIDRVTAEYVGVLTDRKAGVSYAGWPNRDVERILPLLRPGDRCGPGGRYVVVDAGERERLAEFREMVAPSPGNGG